MTVNYAGCDHATKSLSALKFFWPVSVLNDGRAVDDRFWKPDRNIRFSWRCSKKRLFADGKNI